MSLKQYRRKLIIGLSILLVILLLTCIVIWQRGRLLQVQALIASVNLAPRSQVVVDLGEADSTRSGRLVFQFKIIDSDKSKVEMLSQRLGIRSNWTEGASITLNQESLVQLAPLLPIEADIRFEGNDILISKVGLGSLNSSLPDAEFEYASGSGSLKLKSQGMQNFDLSIVNPNQVLRSASESGKLYLSRQLGGIMLLLDQVQTIDLKVNGDSLLGKIRIK